MRQNIFNAGIAFLFSCFVFSCNESSFLEEKPLDFLSPENAYNTYADYLYLVYLEFVIKLVIVYKNRQKNRIILDEMIKSG